MPENEHDSPFSEVVQAENAAEAAVVAEIVRKAYEPRLVPIERGTSAKANVLLVPDGMSTVDVKEHLDAYLEAPERREGTAHLSDLASFCAHVNRFRDDGSAIFANPEAREACLLAVFDYHLPGAASAPRFGKHRARYDFPISDEWKAWILKNGSSMSQPDFAAFVEDRIADVADPSTALSAAQEFAKTTGCELASPSKLIELSRGLNVKVGAKVANAVSLASGEVAMRFETTHGDDDGKPLRVPGAFLIAIPVFRLGAAYQIAVRLRYRVEGPAVKWSLALYRPERVLDHAIREACQMAAAETKLPVFMGTPEEEP